VIFLHFISEGVLLITTTFQLVAALFNAMFPSVVPFVSSGALELYQNAIRRVRSAANLLPAAMSRVGTFC